MGILVWEAGGEGSWGGGASDAELASHEADTTSIHGITDTSVLTTATQLATAFPDIVTVNTWVKPPTTTGTWAESASPAALSAMATTGYVYNSSVALDDAVEWNIPMGAGTWKMYIAVYKDSTSGKATLFLNGTTTSVTLDTYAAAPTFTWVVGSGTFVVASDGLQAIKFKVDGKHASSTGYSFAMGTIHMTRTA